MRVASLAVRPQTEATPGGAGSDTGKARSSDVAAVANLEGPHVHRLARRHRALIVSEEPPRARSSVGMELSELQNKTSLPMLVTVSECILT